MQSATASPREHLTAAQVVALVEADNVTVDFGCDLLNDADVLVSDITDDLAGGEVSRGNYQLIHGTCQLQLSRELNWARDRVRPWMVLDDGTVSARFDLGVYLVESPARTGGRSPMTFDVAGYDKLAILDNPVGATYRVAGGSNVLAAVSQAIVNGGGGTRVFLASSGEDVALPADRLWPIDADTTWLRVINDLLASAGYRGLWCDESGRYRSEPYRSPAEHGAEWAYDTSSPRTIVGEEIVEEADLFGVPNRWVFIRDDPGGGLPVTGDGLYVVENVADGVTSQQARGRVITRVEQLQATSQATLISQGGRMVESDQRINRYVEFTSGPNPLHWHFDVYRVADSDLGIDRRFLAQSWSLPLDGGDMNHRARAV